MLQLVDHILADLQRIDDHSILQKFDEVEPPECGGILVLQSALDPQVPALNDISKMCNFVICEGHILELLQQADQGDHHRGGGAEASPRGSIALYKTGQARAAIQGRDYVTPDDIKALALVTLAHRLIISPSARIKNVDPRAVIQEILDNMPVPGARVRPK